MNTRRTLKLLFSLAFLFTSSGILYSQVPTIEWQKCLGGTLSDGGLAKIYGNDEGSIIQTNDGGIIIAGSENSTDSDVIGNHGKADAWVVKLNSSGKIEWQKCYGGSDIEGFNSIIRTTDGGYIAAGLTKSIDGDVIGNHGNYHSDAWIVKLNSSGDIQWQKCIGGTNDETANSIIQISNGGYIICGTVASNNGDVMGKKGVSANTDVWLIKLDSIGDLEWNKCLGGLGNDYGYSIIKTLDGGYFLGGAAGASGGDVTGYHPDKNKFGYEDAWVVKLNSSFEIEWQKCMGGSSPDWANSVVQCPDGGYVFAGDEQSEDGDVIGNHGVVSGSSYEDAWIVKLDSLGNMVWQKCIGGKYPDVASKIINTIDRGFAVCGFTISLIEGVKSHGIQDAWVIKLNSSGDILWQQCYGGSNTDIGTSIVQASDGSFIFVANTLSTDDEVIGNHGEYDAWVVKLTAPLGVKENPLHHELNLSTYPNPTTNIITLSYALPKASPVDITLYNIAGVQMNEIHQTIVESGKHEIQIDISSYPEGSYVMSVSACGVIERQLVQFVR